MVFSATQTRVLVLGPAVRTPQEEAGDLEFVVICSPTVSGHPGLYNETMPNNNSKPGNKNDKQGMNELTFLVRTSIVTMEGPAKKDKLHVCPNWLPSRPDRSQ